MLILREVLRWQASEVAELLDTSVASVNSALQRARATLAARNDGAPEPEVVSADQQELLARYVDAFERYDITALVKLLHEDAIMSMPPYDFWLRGPEEMGKWFLGNGIGCKGSRLIPVAANGHAAFGSYKPGPDGAAAPVVDPGHRDLRRPDRRAPQLPRHHPLRRLRPPRPPVGTASGEPAIAWARPRKASRAVSSPHGVPQLDRAAQAAGGQLQPGQIVDDARSTGPSHLQRPADDLDAVPRQDHHGSHVFRKHTRTTTGAAEVIAG